MSVEFHSERISSDLFLEHRLASREWVRILAITGTIFLDSALLLTASVLASWLRFGGLPTDVGASFLLLVLPAYFLASFAFESYSLETIRQDVRSMGRANMALLTAAMIAFCAVFGLQVSERLSRLETFYMLLGSTVLLTLGRTMIAFFLRRFRAELDTATYILGDETALAHVGRAHRVVNIRSINWRPSSDDPNFLDAVSRTFRHADRVLLVFADPRERAEWASFMRLTGINSELVEPQLKHIVPSGVGHWAGVPTLVISRGPLTLTDRAMKRALDLAVLALVSVPAILTIAVIAILIRLDTPGPSFFVQERVGRKNVQYRCYKFRTMRTEAIDQDGCRSTARDDQRVTPIGRMLRRASLDELPQLWNVLIGNMSFVGPRPHAIRSTAEGAYFWHAVDEYWSRHAVKPGLTGLAQIRGYRGATQYRRELADRVSSDLEYVNNWSIWLDIKILLKTPFVMMHRNAY